MFIVRRSARRALVLCAILSFAAIAGCAETNPTSPAPAKHVPAVARDGNPPDEPCGGGWILLDGRWVCGGI